MMEKPSNYKTRKNKISAKEMEERLVQLFGQEKPGKIDGKIEVTEEERKRYKKMKNLRALFGNLGRPDLEKEYEELEAKIKMADRGMSEDNPENDRELESGEIPQDLKDFREKWEKEINLSDDKKKAIIDAVNKIPHRATIESDGSRLVEFELGGKTYQSLDVNLAKYSHAKYHWHTENQVELGGMMGDDTKKRKNKKLAEYVNKEKKDRDMEIPTIEFQRDLINKLGDEAGLTVEWNKIAMWMYLTGNYGYYWLTMGDDKSSGSQDSRSSLNCTFNGRYFLENDLVLDRASLCLIACK